MRFIKDNEKTFNEFIRKSKDNKKMGIILGALEIFVSDPELIDELCSFSIVRYGRRLVNAIDAYNENATDLTGEYVISFSYSFIVEILLRSDDVNDILIDIRNNISDLSNTFSVDLRRIIEFVDKDMRTRIIYEMIGSNELLNFKNISQIIKSKDKIENQWEAMISEKEAEWKKEISEREARVEKIKESLDEYNTAFNFVGLYDGFKDLLKEKKGDVKSLLGSLKWSAAFIVLPILIELGFIMYHSSNITSYRETILFSLMPTLSLIVIATYFFRVLLSNYKSVKSQIMQIELRMTLCRFIQSYADYSADLKSKNETTLNKFEEIIFSNILSTDNVDFSAFDGMEKFAGMMGSTKK